MDAYEAFLYLNSIGMGTEGSRFFLAMKSVRVPSGFQVTSPSGNTFEPGNIVPFPPESEHARDWNSFYNYATGEGMSQGWQVEETAEAGDGEDDSVQPYMSELQQQLSTALDEGGVVGAQDLLEAYKNQLKELEGAEAYVFHVEEIQELLGKTQIEDVTKEVSDEVSLEQISAIKDALGTYADKLVMQDIRPGHDSQEYSYIFSAKFPKKYLDQAINLKLLTSALSVMGESDAVNHLVDILSGEKGKKTLDFHVLFPFLETMDRKDTASLIKELNDIFNEKLEGQSTEQNVNAHEYSQVARAVAVLSAARAEQEGDSGRVQGVTEEELKGKIDYLLTKLRDSAAKVQNARHQALAKELETIESFATRVKMMGRGQFLFQGFDQLFGRKVTAQILHKHFQVYRNGGGRVTEDELVHFRPEDFLTHTLIPRQVGVEHTKAFVSDVKSALRGNDVVRTSLARSLLKKSGGVGLSEAIVVTGDVGKNLRLIYDDIAAGISDKLSFKDKNSANDAARAVQTTIEEVLAANEVEIKDRDALKATVDRMVNTLKDSNEWKHANYSTNGHEQHVEEAVMAYCIMMFQGHATKAGDSAETRNPLDFHSFVLSVLGRDAGADFASGVVRAVEDQNLTVSLAVAAGIRVLPYNPLTQKLDWEPSQARAMLDAAGYEGEDISALEDTEVLSDVLYTMVRSQFAMPMSQAVRNSFVRLVHTVKYGAGMDMRGQNILSEDIVRDLGVTTMADSEDTEMHMKNSQVEAHARSVLGEGKDSVVHILSTGDHERGKQVFAENLDNYARTMNLDSETVETFKKYFNEKTDEAVKKLAKKSNAHFGSLFEFVSQVGPLLSHAQGGMNGLRRIDPANGQYFDDSKQFSAGLYGMDGFTWNDNNGDTVVFGNSQNVHSDAIDYMAIKLTKGGDVEFTPYEAKMYQTDFAQPHMNSMDNALRLFAESVKHSHTTHGRTPKVVIKDVKTVNHTHDGKTQVGSTETTFNPGTTSGIGASGPGGHGSPLNR